MFIGALAVIIFAILKLTHTSFTYQYAPWIVMSSGGLAIVISGISRTIRPRENFEATWHILALLIITIGALVVTTGGFVSPFLVLWFIIELLCALVGLQGIILALSLNIIYVAVAFSANWWLGPTTQSVVIFVLLLIPLGIGFMLWRRHFFAPGPGEKDPISNLSERLTEESTKSDIIINSIADGVVVVNDKGHIQLINPSAQQITGWDAHDALDLDYHSILKLTTALDRPIQDGDPIEKVIKANQSAAHTDLTLTSRSSKKLLISIVVSPISSTTGPNHALGAIIVFRDITKEKQEERQQAEFISTASHEMRTPVATIEGYLSLALNANVAQIDDKARDYINKAHEATQHLGRLFADLLTISRAEDGRLTYNPEVVDVVAFVQEIWEGQAQKAQQKQLQYTFLPGVGQGIDVSMVIHPIFYASVDPDHFREVVNNLIDNAIKYTPKGSVIVDVNADDSNVTVSIQDSGIGIPKEDIPHLFQKFYRVDNSDTREIGGTGLGLYIARRIIEQHSGQIWVESEFKKGSTFYIQIPRVSNDEAAFLQQSAPGTQATDTTPATPVAVPPQATPPQKG
jgi:PAS domain S-box-containing protein